MNVLTAIGRVGNDAEVRSTTTGKMVTSWSIAIDSGWGENRITTWLRCTMWGDRGEKVAQYITKGSQIGVSGEFSTREYDRNGVTKTSCELKIDNVTLVGGKDTQKPNSKPATPSARDTYEEDDIPF